MSADYDLWYDANTVDADLKVLCWLSHGPRADDESFDPSPGDQVLLGDDEEPPIRGQIVQRDGDRVTVRMALTRSPAVA